jgi:uncharacterized DUF497 family protein
MTATAIKTWPNITFRIGSVNRYFFNQPILILDDSGHSASEKRWAAFGKTDSNRLLVIIFTKRSNLLRVISARDMNNKERQYYGEY